MKAVFKSKAQRNEINRFSHPCFELGYNNYASSPNIMFLKTYRNRKLKTSFKLSSKFFDTTLELKIFWGKGKENNFSETKNQVEYHISP